MEINYIAILAAAVISMIVGAVWYGALFGKKWMEIVGATEMNMERKKEMQKSARPLYLISFVLTLLQLYVLAHFINAWDSVSGVETALWLWAGFVIPTVAAGSMWNNDSKKISWSRFLIQAGYYLALFIIFGLILSFWR